MRGRGRESRPDGPEKLRRGAVPVSRRGPFFLSRLGKWHSELSTRCDPFWGGSAFLPPSGERVDIPWRNTDGSGSPAGVRTAPPALFSGDLVSAPFTRPGCRLCRARRAASGPVPVPGSRERRPGGRGLCLPGAAARPRHSSPVTRGASEPGPQAGAFPPGAHPRRPGSGPGAHEGCRSRRRG